MFGRLGVAQVFSAFGIFNYDGFMGHSPTVKLRKVCTSSAKELRM